MSRTCVCEGVVDVDVVNFLLTISNFKPLWMWLLSQVAMAGFTEVVTWILCSREENFTMVNRKDDGNTAVIIGNPRTADFEVGSLF